jgi:branched-chain amino acid transport system substrate-binding protein
MVKLISNDYAYKIPEAVNLYKKYSKVDKVFCIQGWGTGDTNALRPMINKDKIVYMSASYDGNLTDPKKTPYNFFISPSYSTTIRLALHLCQGAGRQEVCLHLPGSSLWQEPHQGG